MPSGPLVLPAMLSSFRVVTFVRLVSPVDLTAPGPKVVAPKVCPDCNDHRQAPRALQCQELEASSEVAPDLFPQVDVEARVPIARLLWMD